MSSPPEVVLDGGQFRTFEEFVEHASLALNIQWSGNLDAFNDMLRGAWHPDGGFLLRWVNSARSRECLGHAEMARWLEGILERCHPKSRDGVRDRLEAARRGEGQTMFDLLVEIIEVHGPDGDEFADEVLLVLE